VKRGDGMANNHYVDVSWHSLNKKNEELCGDKVEWLKSDQRTIVVLADGLGSGVKANILATLTTKIMITMLDQGAGLQETIDTITHTLPVCQLRQIAYCTFSIVDIDHELNCRIIEFDNPPVFVFRQHEPMTLDKKVMQSGEKEVLVSELKLKVGDMITLCSDGVIHAGVGNMLNHGWEWSHVNEYLSLQRIKSADKLNRRLMDTCNKLYDESPGDDTTSVTIKIRYPENIQLLTGPPINQERDHQMVLEFMRLKGKKVVCGGTAANIVARELNEPIESDIKYIDPKVPPTAKIKGIDLVTEGVLTLKMVLNELKLLKCSCIEPDFTKEDGVTKLLKCFLEDSTHIHFLVGHAINPAHQNPDFPADLSIKLNVVKQIVKILEEMGKIVTLDYTDR
jgi:serine/threonine protein phosphatase PrpC